MQGRDNESEAELEPPDSFNSPGLGRMRGISLGISMSRDKDKDKDKGTFWQKRGGRREYENTKNAKENHARKQRHWLISYCYSYPKGSSHRS